MKIVTTIIPNIEQPTPIVTAVSKMSELDSLNAKKTGLENTQSGWEIALSIALLVTALAAFLVFVFDSKVRKSSKAIQEVQNDIIRAKDAQLALDLKTKDVEIGALGKKTAEANERVTNAQVSVALAEQHSAEAATKAESFRLDIANANERAASANEIAERERLARIQLEARLADRVLTAATQSELTVLAASHPHGTRADICVFGSTLEIANIAKSLNDSLTAGGWDVRQWQILSGGAVRGILIAADPKADTSIAQAAFKLVSILVSGGIGATPWKFDELVVGGMRNGPPGPVDAPIRIFIGSKQ